MSTSCPICFEPLEGKIRASPSICDHVFCMDCLQKWIKTDNVCPIDRKKFQKIINLDFNATIKVKPKKRKRQRVYYDVSVHCEVCKESTGTLLLCDSCDLAYHCECLTPPVTEIPTTGWHCPVCVDVESRIRPTKITRQKSSLATSSSSSSSTKSSEESVKKKRPKESHKNRKRINSSPKFQEAHHYVRRKQQSQRQAASKSLQIITNIIIEESMKEADDDSNDLMLNFNHQPGPSTSTDSSVSIKDEPSVSSNTASNEEMEDSEFQIGDSDFMDSSSDSESDDITKAIVSFHQQEKLSADDEISEEQFPSHLFQEDEYQDYDVGFESFENTVEENSCSEELDNLDTNPILKASECKDNAGQPQEQNTDFSTNQDENLQKQNTDFSTNQEDNLQKQNTDFSTNQEDNLQKQNTDFSTYQEDNLQKQNIDFSTKQEDNLKLQSDMPVLAPISPFKNHILNDKCNTETLTPVNLQGQIKDSEPQTSQIILESSVSNGYISQLEAENKRLHLLLASLNRHPVIEVSNPVKNLRKENKKLKDIQSNLQKEITELKLEAKMFPSLESKCDSIEKLVKDFKQSLESQQVDISNCIQLEHRLNSATAESQKLQELVDSNQQEITNLQQNIENNNQKLSTVVENLQHLEHIPLEKECHTKENNQTKIVVGMNSTSSSLHVMKSIPFDGKSSYIPCTINPKLTLADSKNPEGVPLAKEIPSTTPKLHGLGNLSNITSLSSSPGNNENDFITIRQSPESLNPKSPSENDIDSSSPINSNFLQHLKDNRNKLKAIISKLNTHQKENNTRKSVITKDICSKEDTVNNLESSVVLNTSSKTATSTFKSSSSGSEKSTPNASFVAVHRNEMNHTKKCMEQAHLKIRNKETKNCDVSSSSENDCIGTCRIISSSFKQLLNASCTTNTSITKESLLEDNNVLSKNVLMGDESNTIDINISPNKINKSVMESGALKDILPSKKQKRNLNPSFSEMKDSDCITIDGDSSCSLQDADDNSTDSNFPDKAILLKLPLRLSFKRTPNNSPKQNSETVSSTSATASISQRISERATYLQDWNSKMAQPKIGLQTSPSNCDSLLSTSANNIKRPLSFSIPIAVSLRENQKDYDPLPLLCNYVNSTDFCKFNNVSADNYIGSDNLPPRIISIGEKGTEIGVESTAGTQQHASLTSSPQKLVKNDFLLNIDKSGDLSVPPGTLDMTVMNCLNMKNLSVRKDGTLFHNWKRLT